MKLQRKLPFFRIFLQKQSVSPLKIKPLLLRKSYINLKSLWGKGEETPFSALLRMKKQNAVGNLPKHRLWLSVNFINFRVTGTTI